MDGWNIPECSIFPRILLSGRLEMRAGSTHVPGRITRPVYSVAKHLWKATQCPPQVASGS